MNRLGYQALAQKNLPARARVLPVQRGDVPRIRERVRQPRGRAGGERLARGGASRAITKADGARAEERRPEREVLQGERGPARAEASRRGPLEPPATASGLYVAFFLLRPRNRSRRPFSPVRVQDLDAEAEAAGFVEAGAPHDAAREELLGAEVRDLHLGADRQVLRADEERPALSDVRACSPPSAAARPRARRSGSRTSRDSPCGVPARPAAGPFAGFFFTGGILSNTGVRESTPCPGGP